jgi:hypothetical protein
MPVEFSDIVLAFHFVSMDLRNMNRAYLNRETGERYYTSEMGDSDELPEDIDDHDKYIDIPHKSELGLGKPLVMDFTATRLPDDLDRVSAIFRKKGAYPKYKNLLEERGLLEEWHAYEEERQEAALREWCRENDIVIK